MPDRVRIGKGPRLLAGAMLGACVALLPAVAGSETIPSIAAHNAPGLYGPHSWEPSSATIAQGGTVAISNNSDVPHGVHWLTGPTTPECKGVVVGTKETESGTQWSGTCTFAAAGTYAFDCTVHGAAMQGSITVNGEGTAVSTTTAQQAPTTPTSTTVAPTLLAGSTASALRVGSAAHGTRIRGTIDVGPEGAGSRLEVRALVARGALGRRHGPASVLVGHVVETSVPQGVSHFALTIGPAARRALHARSRLKLTIELRLDSIKGASVTATRTLIARGRG